MVDILSLPGVLDCMKGSRLHAVCLHDVMKNEYCDLE